MTHTRKPALLRRALLAGAMLAGTSLPMLACDLESEGAAEYLSQFDYSAMVEEERLAAERRALQAFHDMKMAEARAAFTRRFKVDSQGGPAAAPAGAGKTGIQAPPASGR